MKAMLLTMTVAIVLAPAPAAAHCDAVDGPVVAAAHRALSHADVSIALVWVAPGAEGEVQKAFDAARKVRLLSPAAHALADRYFAETVVRLHRVGEGEPYTGLKPAGHVPPAIAMADAALESGSLEPLLDALAAGMRERLAERFAAVTAARKAAAPGDVEAGRRAVAAYVAFIQLAERLGER